MRKLRSALCAVLCLVMLFSLAGCSGGGYRIVDEYSGEGSYYIAFRKGDRLQKFVTAAMEELSASNTLRSMSITWFGENLVDVHANSDALEAIEEEKPERFVTVGIDVTNMPMSYVSGGGYAGFDVDLITFICGYLGWGVEFHQHRRRGGGAERRQHRHRDGRAGGGPVLGL